jgi:tRNA A37 threonylcarbamoyladenosine modification protein TsaB
VLAVLDARRGEVFAAAWRAGDRAVGRQRTPMLDPRALRPELLAARIPELGPLTLTVGDGAVEFREVLEQPRALIPDDRSELHRVSAINHCRLAGGRSASAPDEVAPVYLRLPDAEIAHRAAGKK